MFPSCYISCLFVCLFFTHEYVQERELKIGKKERETHTHSHTQANSHAK